ncbi:MAG: ACP S-malonyltransferase [Bacteroidales bacterium]|jgi:[acyl-carrier-protein] S-malonyltransferase|nr:ACP S-malonyltransferase [Bacteroidales bacterium]MDD2264975.1 ACP S-malonyltransferase [Bacteroidales bacterium]MDD2832143.1 ACP S-malonyltransferase [Bacteroidales bacterium]MDD3208795.1 ACP S-malonyltransferase [Bacteroidales bacterium]MDD3697358.1 ACP S-malonyltransferase [Bacteroidales bacterium]
MKAYVFPGQGAQFTGMGKDLYDADPKARELFDRADDILGFSLSRIMFEGTTDALKQTKVTQPAIFLHSVAAAMCDTDFMPDMVAGHSLGEFSALTAAGALSFEEGLKLVSARAQAMQAACEEQPSTMAAVLSLEDGLVEKICAKVTSIIPLVIPANYNCPGQIVISGTVAAVEEACRALKEAGAKRAVILPVGGAFHSPLMDSARKSLETAIDKADMKKPVCPVYQNVDALPHTVPADIKDNLKKQLTSPVKWTQTIQKMVADGAKNFTEYGPGTVLTGMIKKIAPELFI